MAYQVVWVLLLGLVCGCDALTFTLAHNESRCVTEALRVHALLTGDWAFSAGEVGADAVAGEVVVRNPANEVVSDGKDTSGQFHVTAQADGPYSVCVTNLGEGAQQAMLHIKTALEVEDHSMVAKKEHVEAIEAELDRMEKMATHVYEEMNEMRARSELAQATDASTRGRLLWVEVLMLVTLLAMGFWQIHYLKRFFQAKKII